MDILLNGIGYLPAETVVHGRHYQIRVEKEILTAIQNSVITFEAPGGVPIEIFFIDDLAKDRRDTLIRVTIDHVKVLDEFGNWAYFIQTTDLPDQRLRKLVEQALRDLIAEEKRQDPSGRHGRR